MSLLFVYGSVNAVIGVFGATHFKRLSDSVLPWRCRSRQLVIPERSCQALTARLLTLILLFCTLQANALCPKPLKVGWELWEPYQYVDKNGRLTGLDIELVSAIVQNARCAVEFRELPWKRHLRELAIGRTDVALGASYTVERASYAYFSEPYRQEMVVLLVRRADRSEYPYEKLGDLPGTSFRLGTTLGYHYGSEYNRLKDDPEFRKLINEVHTDGLNYQMLFRKRIDGMLVDPISARATLSQDSMENQVAPLFTVYSADLYLMFSKKSVNPLLVERLNESLRELRENGLYDEILSHYLTPEASQ